MLFFWVNLKHFVVVKAIVQFARHLRVFFFFFDVKVEEEKLLPLLFQAREFLYTMGRSIGQRRET